MRSRRSDGWLVAAVLVLGACTSAGTAGAPPGPSTAGSASDPTTTAVATTAGATSSPTPGSTTAVVPPTTPPPATPPVTTAASTPPCPAGELVMPDGRSAIVRPAGGPGPAPLLLVLHGFKATPEGQEQFSELTPAATAAGITVVYPRGTPLDDLGFGWNSGVQRDIDTLDGIDDVGFLAALVERLVASGCADPARVVLAGESNGGSMVLAAVCDPRLGGVVRAVLMVNPGVDAGVLARCSGAGTPVPMVVTAGDRDTTVPYDGGRRPFLAQERWLPTIADVQQGCTGEIERRRLDADLETVAPAGCRPCLVLYHSADGTHTWPGSTQGANGLRPGAFPATEVAIELAGGDPSSCAADVVGG